MTTTSAVEDGLSKAQTATLPCGLRVVHMRLPGAVAVGASLGIDVGSADEPNDWAGISHFLEHLVFRGTAAYPDSAALGQAIEAVGGDFNAFTGKSYTQYICSAPLEHRRLVARIPAELVVRPLLRQEDVDDERPVVIREIGLEEDSASRRVARALEQAIWPGSPMARPIIGWPETLRRVTAVDVRRYWAAHYVPAQATFALAGDLSLDEALELAGDAVGPWRSLDQATTTVLATLAGEGEGSLVVRSLVRKRGLLLTGGALAWLNRDAGVLGLTGSARPAAVGAAVEGLLAAIRRLQRPPRPADFRRAAGYVRGEILRQWLRPLDVAIQLCHQALMGDTEYGPRRELRELDAVTPERVQALARALFAPARLRLAVAGPSPDAGALERALAAHAAAPLMVASPGARVAAPRLRTVANGLRLAATPCHGGLATIALAIPCGSLAEVGAVKPGAALLLARLLTQGTPSFPSAGVARPSGVPAGQAPTASSARSRAGSSEPGVAMARAVPPAR